MVLTTTRLLSTLLFPTSLISSGSATAVCTVSDNVNFYQNPSFETGDLTDWTSLSPYHVTDQGVVTFGKASNGDNYFVNQANHEFEYLSQELTGLQVGSTYTLAVDYKFAWTGPGSGGGYCYMTWSKVSPLYPSLNPEWAIHSITWTPTASTVNLYFVFGYSEYTTLEFDNFKAVGLGEVCISSTPTPTPSPSSSPIKSSSAVLSSSPVKSSSVAVASSSPVRSVQVSSSSKAVISPSSKALSSSIPVPSSIRPSASAPAGHGRVPHSARPTPSSSAPWSRRPISPTPKPSFTPSGSVIAPSSIPSGSAPGHGHHHGHHPGSSSGSGNHSGSGSSHESGSGSGHHSGSGSGNHSGSDSGHESGSGSGNHSGSESGSVSGFDSDSVTTSTILTTRTSTVTACPSTVTNCPARDQTTYLTTETVVVGTTICPITEGAHPTVTATSSGQGSMTVPMTTSTAFITRTSTITACPSSVKDCPASEKATYVTTETIVDYSTICPITAAEATQTASSTPSSYIEASATETTGSGSTGSGSTGTGSTVSESTGSGNSSGNDEISTTIIYSTKVEFGTTETIAIATEVLTFTITQATSTGILGIGAVGVPPLRSTHIHIVPTPSVFATSSSSVTQKSSGVGSHSSSTTSSAAPVYTGAASHSFTFSTGLLGALALLVMRLV